MLFSLRLWNPPPPILRISSDYGEGPEPGVPSKVHQMVVDRVSSILLSSSQASSDSDQVMSDSEDDVGGSSKGEEPMEMNNLESNDLMTLV